MIKKIFPTVLLLLILIGLYVSGPNYPEFFTHVYNKTLYYGIDHILHPVTAFFPFSIGDVLYAVAVLYLVYRMVLFIRKRTFVPLLLFSFNALLVFFVMFQLLWGLNNYKYSVSHRLGLEQHYSRTDLDSLTHYLITAVNDQHRELFNDSLKKVIIPFNLELFNETATQNYKKLPDHLKELLTQNNINKVKPSFYSALQSYAGFSGYFNPFTHENQVNTEIPTIGMPVTVAHEMAHQQGIASEAEANFFGYEVMLLSSRPEFRYAANLYALKYCLKEYRNINEEEYQSLFRTLAPGIRQNILDSEAFWQSKRNFSSFFFKNLYGRFLKINNQKEGMRSYNKFVDLLINYNKQYPPS